MQQTLDGQVLVPDDTVSASKVRRDAILLYKDIYPSELMQYAKQTPSFSSTFQEIADLFQVSRNTIRIWCRTQPEFGDTVKQIQDGRNDYMAQKLFHAAAGYPYEERKIVRDQDGMLLKEEITEKYLPENIQAIRLWLINRNGTEWKAKPEDAVQANVTINLVNNLEEFR